MKQSSNQNFQLASHIMKQITEMADSTFVTGLGYWQNQKFDNQINGDIVLNVVRPSGGAHVLICDFVGHDLAAATAALPVAEMFYTLTNKGFGLSDILKQINQKLVRILPEDFFCAAVGILLTQENEVLAIWNGGMPDVLVVDKNNQVKRRIKSRYLPLGIKSELTKEDLETDFVEVEPGDRVFATTTGVLSICSDNGNTFSCEDIEKSLQAGLALNEIKQSILHFGSDSIEQNDITLVDWIIPEPNTLVFEGSDSDVVACRPLPASEWTAEFHYTAETLKSVDVLPLLTDVVMGLQAIKAHRQRIYTILAEMFTNALEHGVLGLDSALKEDPHGFIKFYQERTERLEALTDASIKVKLSHRAEGQGGVLTIEVTDSGDGFDYQKRESDLAKNMTLSGRGIDLVQQLCKSFHYSGKGNCATAEYYWHG